MKVLVFRNDLLPISETFIREQVLALRRTDSQIIGSRLISGLRLPAHRSWIINESTLAGRIRELYFLRTRRSARLTEFIRHSRASLIHAHFGPDACTILPFAQRARLPLITTFHGYDTTTTDDHWQKSRFGRRYLARRDELRFVGNTFLAVSNFVRKQLIASGFADERIIVHYIGVDTHFFKPDPSIARKNTVLFAGRLKENKGCCYLIKAMKSVAAIEPEAELVVIGDGPLRRELQREAEYSLRSFRFLGAQPPEEVRRQMQMASVFCVPSVEISSGESEAFGLAFCEAQACGTPVVSFATGGIPEAVKDGETGLLADAKDVAQLSAHISLLLKNREVWHRLAEAGRRRVEISFNLHEQTSKLESIYEDVVSRDSAGSNDICHMQAGYGA